MEPRIIHKLEGEEVSQVEVGASHAVARSLGGDLFVWGFNKSGKHTQKVRTESDRPTQLLAHAQVSLALETSSAVMPQRCVSAHVCL